jgi:hypothetical protein
MRHMRQTGHHVVLVRDHTGKVVHTHEVVYFDGADQLDDSQLQVEAIEAARRAQSQDDELVATVSTEDDLERIRDATWRKAKSSEAH